MSLRYYDNYNSTTILLLFKFVFIDVFKTMYNILSKRQKQFKRDKILICLLINLDNDNAFNLIAKKDLHF